MNLRHIIPVLFGIAILLFGIYLVSTHGSVAGVYLPGLIGLPACGANSTSCTGFSPYGAVGVGTIVAIFGLGILAASVRNAVFTSSSPTGGMSALPPELASTLELARTRMQSMPTSMSMGVRPNTVYCSRCGQANVADAKFCHQCGAAMPVAPAPPSPTTQP